MYPQCLELLESLPESPNKDAIRQLYVEGGENSVTDELQSWAPILLTILRGLLLPGEEPELIGKRLWEKTTTLEESGSPEAEFLAHVGMFFLLAIPIPSLNDPTSSQNAFNNCNGFSNWLSLMQSGEKECPKHLVNY